MKTQVAIAALVAALYGCTPTGSGSIGATASTMIRSAQVTGTDGVASAGSSSAHVDPTQNGGVFLLSFDAASSTRPYRAEWYVSADPAYSADDKLILGRNCDQSLGDCPNQSASFSCQFTSSVKTVCAAGTGSDTTDLSSYFGAHAGLPASYYLVFRACDGLFADCQTKAIPAVFN